MKFTMFAVAAVAAVSTTNGQLTRCDVSALLPIANGDQASQCAEDSGFSLMMAAITENSPKPEQYAKICASDMCQAVLQKLYEIVPTDCALKSGGSLKALTEPVVNSCKASAPAAPVPGAVPGVVSAPVPGAVPDVVSAPVSGGVSIVISAPAPEEPANGADQFGPERDNSSPTQTQQKQC